MVPLYNFYVFQCIFPPWIFIFPRPDMRHITPIIRSILLVRGIGRSVYPRRPSASERKGQVVGGTCVRGVVYHCSGCTTCIYREDEGGGNEHGDDGAESGGESGGYMGTGILMLVPCQQPTSFSMLNLKNVCGSCVARRVSRGPPRIVDEISRACLHRSSSTDETRLDCVCCV